MDWKTYAEKASAQMAKGDTIGAITTLEEGVLRLRSSELSTLLDEARRHLSHLADSDSYRRFYEKQQTRSPKYYKLGRRIERAVKGLLGVRTRRVIEGCRRNPRFLRVQREIHDGGYRRILDVGCFEGHFSIGLGAMDPLLDVTGVEIASTNVRIANELNRYENVHFVQGFAEDLPALFPDQQFDFVMLLEILEHVIDVEKVLRAAFAVLRPGGRVAITVPAGEDEEEDHDEHVRFFSDALINQYFGKMPNLGVEKIRLPERKGKPEESSNYISFTRPNLG